MILDVENLDEHLAELREAGAIGEGDEREIRGKFAVPEEWMPYAKGEGPAPPEERDGDQG